MRSRCSTRDETTCRRTRGINQLHRLLRELLAGGVPSDLTAAKAAAALRAFRPHSTPERIPLQLSRELIADVPRLDRQRADHHTQAPLPPDEHDTRPPQTNR